MLANRKLQRRCFRFIDCRQAREQLLLRLHFIKRSLHFSGQFQYLITDAQFRPRKFTGCDLLAQRNQKDIEKILRNRSFDIRCRWRPIWKPSAYSKRRILQKTGLDQIRVGNSDVLKRCLQLAIVEESDLNGAISRQWPMDQRVNVRSEE